MKYIGKHQKLYSSPYNVWWVEFAPIHGVVTKHDQRKISPHYISDKISWHPSARKLHIHFGDKRMAIDYITHFDKQLDKQYECRLFCDKQLKIAKNPVAYDKNGNPYIDVQIPFTTKQKREIYYIG